MSIKKLATLLIVVLLVLTAVGCSSANNQPAGDNPASDVDDGTITIPFTYFFRGFTTYGEHGAITGEEVERLMDLGCALITNLDDWLDFVAHYGGVVANYGWPDFSEYNLVVFGNIYGGATAGVTADDIERLYVDSTGQLTYMPKEVDNAHAIWADNYGGAVRQMFICILQVRPEDLPADCARVYTAAGA